MPRRILVLALMVGLSQLASGCCWCRPCCWRPHLFHGCAPCSAPISCAPPSCPSCFSSPVTGPGPGYGPGAVSIVPSVVPPGGVTGPLFTNPTPITGVPSIVPPTDTPNPMPGVRPGG